MANIIKKSVPENIFGTLAEAENFCRGLTQLFGTHEFDISQDPGGNYVVSIRDRNPIGEIEQRKLCATGKCNCVVVRSGGDR